MVATGEEAAGFGEVEGGTSPARRGEDPLGGGKPIAVLRGVGGGGKEWRPPSREDPHAAPHASARGPAARSESQRICITIVATAVALPSPPQCRSSWPPTQLSFRRGAMRREGSEEAQDLRRDVVRAVLAAIAGGGPFENGRLRGREEARLLPAVH